MQLANRSSVDLFTSNVLVAAISIKREVPPGGGVGLFLELSALARSPRLCNYAILLQGEVAEWSKAPDC
jgi:hypothetical protein